MQILKMFAVFDKKAAVYTHPHFHLQVGQAIRGFEDAVNNAETAFFRHPADYNLSHIGEWNDSTGILTPLKAPVIIEEAINLKAPEKK